uniref:Transposase n=1 Tax=Strongyloides venezuelensis TaxID=75913 RepID=A0A0K0FDM8_STRVS
MLKFLSSVISNSKKWVTKKQIDINNQVAIKDKLSKLNFPKYQQNGTYNKRFQEFIDDKGNIPKLMSVLSVSNKSKIKERSLFSLKDRPTIKAIVLLYGGFKRIFKTIFLFRKYKIKTVYKVITTILLLNAYGLFKFLKS